MAHCFEVSGQTVNNAGEHTVSKAVYLAVAGKQKEGPDSQYPPQGHTSRDLTSSHWGLFLKIPLPPKGTTTKLSTDEPVGVFTQTMYSLSLTLTSLDTTKRKLDRVHPVFQRILT